MQYSMFVLTYSFDETVSDLLPAFLKPFLKEEWCLEPKMSSTASLPMYSVYFWFSLEAFFGGLL